MTEKQEVEIEIIKQMQAKNDKSLIKNESHLIVGQVKAENITREHTNIASSLSRSIAFNISDERSSKFGYDMLCGLSEGNFLDRLNAWIDWYNNWLQGDTSSVDEERDGVWVPAIPLENI